MKKLYFLALNLLFSLALFSQNVQTITFDNYVGSSWQAYMKQTNTYNGSNYLTNNFTQLWNTTTTSWKNSSQINYTNNGNGNIQQYITQTWDSISNVWINSQRGTYTYNGANKPLTITYETYTGGSWVTSMKQTYTYDGSNYLTHTLTQLWDSPSSTWKNNSQNNYTNNGNGTVQQYISQSWDNPNNVWKNSLRATHTYNSSNKPLTITYESYPVSSWQNSMKQISTYDGNGYLTKSLTQLWDTQSSTFKDYSQINYTNNVDGTIHQYISQNWSNSIWSNSMRATFTYTASTGIADNESVNFNVFPNPCTEILNITFLENSNVSVSIINQLGQLISEKIYSGNEAIIDVKSLAPALYFIILKQQDKISVTKFIREP